MKWTMAAVFAAGGWLSFATAAAFAEEPNETTFLESLKAGTASVSLRYRVESVSDDAVGAEDALASTLRTTLAYRTAVRKKFSLFAEAENVSVIGDDRYNNAGARGIWNRVGNRPVVADPALTELNQAYLRWDDGDTRVTIGRQEILLGDLRFVGSVGWRQNHQSFDALSLVHEGTASWTFVYVFATAVHRIFGDSQDMASHFLNARYDWDKVGAVTLYGYLLDYDHVTAAALSSATFGAELAGKRDLEGNWDFVYELEAAQQSDAGDNPGNLDARYWHAALGAARALGAGSGGAASLAVRAGIEVLEGSERDGQFRTPLATLHKFNGWGDKFLATPTDGLEDRYLTVSGKSARGVSWAATYHDFGASSGGASYGDELDLQVSYTTSWKQTFAFKAALYDSNGFARDTDKLMAWTAYAF